ncbi:unannotated protein [freshwater metagenome]|uniref:Unannotated protein n=1 Tax=freshwater metagenome TaxID=449393 RepID=A0A6J7NPA4_9ZZZZ
MSTPDTDDSANPVLVNATRSGFTESRHRGSVLLLATDGAQRQFGHAGCGTYPRSSLKPLQATAMVRAGLRLEPQLLALVTSSHSATPEQVSAALDILQGAGLTEHDLRCPADLPELPELPDDIVGLIRAGGSPSPLQHNCSGKHSGMLATCVLNGWSTHDYLDRNHPLQRLILSTVEEFTGETVTIVGTDGCGAPVPVVGLPALARAIARVAVASPDTAEGQVAAAARAWPVMVGGPERCISQVMPVVPGLLVKEGAEGVWVAALTDGRTMVAKVDDGALRALPAILAATLQSWGFDHPVIDRWAADPILGGGLPVGALTASTTLRDWLAEG